MSTIDTVTCPQWVLFGFFLFCLGMVKVKKILKYSEESMTNALSDVRSGMSYRAACLKHGIPRITLMRKHKRNLPAKTKMGPKTSFSEEQENMLAYWIITMSKAGFPLSKETKIMYISKDNV